MLVASVLGARPQFIKAAVLSRKLRENGFEEIIVHTGQHYDYEMSDCFFDEMGICEPHFKLNVGSGLHGEQTGAMLARIEKVLLSEKPELVIVYGDTNTTLAGSLAAVKLHIPAAHIEAGLRSFNRKMPEEINRILTDHASDYLFTPTQTGFDNLTHEGIDKGKIFLVGDVMYDAALLFAARAEEKSRILQKYNLEPQNFILATVHRAENTDDETRLTAIMEGLAEVSSEHNVVLPLHPRTKNALKRLDAYEKYSQRLSLIDPVGYLDMTMLEKNAKLIATDSGGVQKEAFFHRVPCVTLRDETEWVELVELGWNFLAKPVGSGHIVDIITGALSHKPDTDASPYGDGDACGKIAAALAGKF